MQNDVYRQQDNPRSEEAARALRNQRPHLVTEDPFVLLVCQQVQNNHHKSGPIVKTRAAGTVAFWVLIPIEVVNSMLPDFRRVLLATILLLTLAIY